MFQNIIFSLFYLTSKYRNWMLLIDCCNTHKEDDIDGGQQMQITNAELFNTVIIIYSLYSTNYHTQHC